MHIVSACDPVSAIRQHAREQRARSLPIRIWRALMQAWMRRLERQIGRAQTEMHRHPVAYDWWGIAAAAGDRRFGQ